MVGKRKNFMIKHLIGLMVVFTGLGFSQSPIIGEYQGNCEQGNNIVNTANINSATKVMKSFPGCTVAVYITGSSPATLAALYTNATGSAKANPFTATSDGSFQFFTDSPVVDIRKSGGGIVTPFTLGSQVVLSPGTGTTDALYPTLFAACTAAHQGTLYVTRTWTNTPTIDLAAIGCKVVFTGNGRIQSAVDGTVTIGGYDCPPSQWCFDATTNAHTYTAGSFVVGTTYTIVTPGSTNFIAIGASTSDVGVTFTATGAGTGTGTADIAGIQLTGDQGPISVTSFGATIASSNNTTQNRAAMIACPPNGCSLTVPTGTYKGSFVFPTYPKSIRVLCQGQDSTILQAASSNTPLFSLGGTVGNNSSATIEIGNCSLKAHASGSSGAMIIFSGMVAPYFHDLTYLSNGSGNYAQMFRQDDLTSGFTLSFGATVARIKITLQSGPTTVVSTAGSASINTFDKFFINNNTGMTKVFDFGFSATGGNIVSGLLCEGNASADCTIPGDNSLGLANYYEGPQAGYITGNGGNQYTSINERFSGHSPGTGITCTLGENSWTFINPIFDSTSLDLVTAGCINSGGLVGSMMYNLGIASMTGGISTSPVNPPIVFGAVVQTGVGGTLPAGDYHYRFTSVNAAGQSEPGANIAVHVPSNNSAIVFQLTPVNGAAKYNIYGRDCPASAPYTSPNCGYLYSDSNVKSAQNGWAVDDGSTTPTASVPATTDTTGNVNIDGQLYALRGYNFLAAESAGGMLNNPVYTWSVANGLPGGLGNAPWPDGFQISFRLDHALNAGAACTLTLNGITNQLVSQSTGPGSPIVRAVPAGALATAIWDLPHTSWILQGQ